MDAYGLRLTAEVASISFYIILCRYRFSKLLQTPIHNPIDSFHRSSTQVVIVGSGICGITAAKTFVQYGYTHITILEASTEIGGVWRSDQYEGASLQGPYWMYQFADFAWPRDLVKGIISPGKAAVQEYIRRYAEKYNVFSKVDIKYQCRVKTAVRDAHRNSWIIRIAESDEVIEADILIMAIGNNSSSPIIPHIPNEHKYRGHIVHSSEIGNGDILKSAHNIAIVGGSKSAYDIGQMQPHNTTLIMRTPHYWTPRWLLLLPFFDRIAYALFSGYKVNKSDRSWLTRVLDEVFMPLVAVGINRPDSTSLLDDIMNGGGLHFTENGLLLENGQEVEADVVVFGTGFQPTRAFQEIFEGVELQDTLDDGLYLYKYIYHPKLPNVFFLGFKDPSLNMPSNASIQSLWTMFCAAGIAQLPALSDMEEMISTRQQNTRQCFHFSSTSLHDFFLAGESSCDYSYTVDLLRDCKGFFGKRVASFWCHPANIWSSGAAFGAIFGAEIITDDESNNAVASDSTALV
ncbi:flavin-containing monooxygenase [Skeletonema marinoi]|uniref:Flavin-containing monooxygenase n=1 Tax=Skeletonema marinoi TaxID=267567 RepID=A0AAD8YKR5_9STRA|nr:flavin-containing monooxygenase [Skeletonema marinoi]